MSAYRSRTMEEQVKREETGETLNKDHEHESHLALSDHQKESSIESSIISISTDKVDDFPNADLCIPVGQCGKTEDTVSLENTSLSTSQSIVQICGPVTVKSEDLALSENVTLLILQPQKGISNPATGWIGSVPISVTGKNKSEPETQNLSHQGLDNMDGHKDPIVERADVPSETPELKSESVEQNTDRPAGTNDSQQAETTQEMRCFSPPVTVINETENVPAEPDTSALMSPGDKLELQSCSKCKQGSKGQHPRRCEKCKSCSTEVSEDVPEDMTVEHMSEQDKDDINRRSLSTKCNGRTEKADKQNTPNTKQYKCSECSQAYVSSANLNKHIKKVHSDQHSQNISNQETVDQTSDEHKGSLHCKRERKLERNFQCKDCEKRYTMKPHLQEHILRCHKPEEKAHKCEICGKSFIYRGHLVIHQKQHKGENFFTCNICGKNMVSATGLKIHIRGVHTKETRFKCDICDYKCYDKTPLRLHRLTHTKDRPAKCSLCEASFIENRWLIVHMRRCHTFETPYECGYCSKRFICTRDRLDHTRRYHPGQPVKGENGKTGDSQSSSSKNNDADAVPDLDADVDADMDDDADDDGEINADFDANAKANAEEQQTGKASDLHKHKKGCKQRGKDGETEENLDRVINDTDHDIQVNSFTTVKEGIVTDSISDDADVNEEGKTEDLQSHPAETKCPFPQECSSAHPFEEENTSSAEIADEGKLKSASSEFDMSVANLTIPECRNCKKKTCKCPKKGFKTCKTCGQVFSGDVTKDLILKHMAEHENSDIETARRNTRSRTKTENSFEHVLYMPKSRNCKCDQCDKIFISKKHLKMHKRTAHQKELKLKTTEISADTVCTKESADQRFDLQLKSVERNADQTKSHCNQSSEETGVKEHFDEDKDGKREDIQQTNPTKRISATTDRVTDGSVGNDTVADMTNQKTTENMIKRNRGDDQNLHLQLQNKRSVNTGEVRFTCNECGKTFKQKLYMRRHMMTCHNQPKDKRHMCETCGKAFLFPHLLRGHQRETHEANRLCCNICGKQFLRDKLKHHIERVHNKVKRFKCDTCDYASYDFQKLKFHSMRHTKEFPVKCKICNTGFKEKRYLEVHIRRHHTFEKPLKCDFCAVQFFCTQSHLQHTKKCHKEQLGMESQETTNNKSVESPTETLSSNINQVNDERGNEQHMTSCNISDKNLQTDSLKQHIQPIHNNTVEKPFKCHLCTKQFAYARYCHDHIRRCHEKKGKGGQETTESSSSSQAAHGAQKHLNWEGETSQQTASSSTEPVQDHRSELLDEDLSQNCTQKNTNMMIKKCHMCNFECSTKREIRLHLYRVHNIKPFKCERCDAVYAVEEGLLNHMRTHHIKDNIFLCHACLKPFFSSSECEAHKTRCRKIIANNFVQSSAESNLNFANPARKFKCNICGKDYVGRTGLRRHMLAEHLKTKPFTCDICQKGFYEKLNLKIHYRRHSGERPHLCDICSESFVTNTELKKHVHNNHSKRERNFTCDLCDSKFYSKYYLKIHRYSHTGEKPHKCKYCDKRFTNSSALTKHHRTHTGEKPFSCNVCGKKFAQMSTLQSHDIIHTGRRAYKCEVCGLMLKRRSSLRVHRQVHTGIKPYKCVECGKGLGSDKAMKKHKAWHEKIRKKSETDVQKKKGRSKTAKTKGTSKEKLAS